MRTTDPHLISIYGGDIHDFCSWHNYPRYL
nr:MAG TPA: hypothetical protein [Caudoviricetes sp.]